MIKVIFKTWSDQTEVEIKYEDSDLISKLARDLLVNLNISGYQAVTNPLNESNKIGLVVHPRMDENDFDSFVDKYNSIDIDPSITNLISDFSDLEFTFMYTATRINYTKGKDKNIYARFVGNKLNLDEVINGIKSIDGAKITSIKDIQVDYPY